MLLFVVKTKENFTTSPAGSTKYRKEHKGVNLFKNTRISTTRDNEEHKGTNLCINARFQQQGTMKNTREQIYL